MAVLLVCQASGQLGCVSRSGVTCHCFYVAATVLGAHITSPKLSFATEGAGVLGTLVDEFSSPRCPGNDCRHTSALCTFTVT